MSTSLKRLFGMLVAGVALSLAILAMLPGMAEAQDTASVLHNTQTANQNADATSVQSDPSEVRLVVYPGDTLWSISQRRLGPDATPSQVGGEVGRILELNHERLAGNPHLIFPGQELLLPAPEPALPEPALSEPVPIHDGAADESSVVPPNAPAAAPQAGEVVPSAQSLQEQDQEAYDEGWRWTAEEPVASDAPQEGEAAPSVAPPAEPSQEEEQQQQQEDQEVYDDDGQTWIDRLLIGLGMLAMTLGAGAILLAVIAPSERGGTEEEEEQQQAAPEWEPSRPHEEPSSISPNRREGYLPEEQHSSRSRGRGV